LDAASFSTTQGEAAPTSPSAAFFSTKLIEATTGHDYPTCSQHEPDFNPPKKQPEYKSPICKVAIVLAIKSIKSKAKEAETSTGSTSTASDIRAFI
jgi:hypothetical protein